MKNKINKFPHIGDFKKVIHNLKSEWDFRGVDKKGEAIFKHESDYPLLEFTGSVKLDGTNAAFGFNMDGEEYFQSRTRMLGNGTDGNDNSGFAAFMHLKLNKPRINKILKKEGALFFGEWVGKGIQKRTGIATLPRRLVIFDLKFQGYPPTEEFYRSNTPDGLLCLFSEDEIEYLNSEDIWFIDQFEKFKVTVDFNNPEIAAKEMEAMVAKVEDCCPVAKAMGVVKKRETSCVGGEGIVWKKYDHVEDTGFWFKTKGEKHKNTRTKSKIPVDTEKLKNVEAFVDFALTEVRMEQGMEVVKSDKKDVLEMEDAGAFLKWINSDISRECEAELTANKITMKDAGRTISHKAVKWFKINY